MSDFWGTRHRLLMQQYEKLVNQLSGTEAPGQVPAEGHCQVGDGLLPGGGWITLGSWTPRRRLQISEQRAENSHQPTRARERAMKKFTSPGGAQRFLSAFSGISPHFRPRRHRLTAAQYRHEMTTRFTTWNEVVGLPTA